MLFIQFLFKLRNSQKLYNRFFPRSSCILKKNRVVYSCTFGSNHLLFIHQKKLYSSEQSFLEQLFITSFTIKVLFRCYFNIQFCFVSANTSFKACVVSTFFVWATTKNILFTAFSTANDHFITWLSLMQRRSLLLNSYK